MRFTDEDGREYKPTDGGKIPVDAFLIRPVKQEPRFELDWKWKHDGVTEVRVKVPDTNSTQARAIKAWIESGMKYLNDPMKDFPNEVAGTYNAARKAMGDK